MCIQKPNTKSQGRRGKDREPRTCMREPCNCMPEARSKSRETRSQTTIMHDKNQKPRAKRQGPGAKDQDPRTLQELRTKSHCKDPAGTMDQEPWSRGQGNIGEVIQYKLAVYM